MIPSGWGSSVLSRAAAAAMLIAPNESKEPKIPSAQPSQTGMDFRADATEFTGTTRDPPRSPSTDTSTP